jgi:membrane-associated phospholipid phosphatase
MNGLYKWSIWLVVTALAVAISYVWLDRPIAVFVHEVVAPFRPFEKLELVSDIGMPVTLCAGVALAWWGLKGGALSRLQTVLMLAAACLMVADAVKDQVKFAFGRTWPVTWIHNNPSFIRDGVYGFHPFHGGPGFASFPSGHTAVTCAALSVLWICYPRFRVLYGLGMLAMAAGLVVTNFHFLSDVIAGAFLGISIGWLSVSLWELGAHKVRPQAEGLPKDKD